MLPADLYVRAGRMGDTGFFSEAEQRALTEVEGVRSAAFIRSQNMLLRPDRPAVTLLTRELPAGAQAPALPFRGPVLRPAADAPPAVWISEVVADMMRVNEGSTIGLPVGGAWRTFTVAGIWRDYARQNGAVVLERSVYVKLTGDARANEAAIAIDEGRSPLAVADGIRQALDGADGLDISTPRDLKALSLSIFDRTFAITYALEAAAVLIGIFGVSASFSAQALARRREFGVLRHIGMTRRQIMAMLGLEGSMVGIVGVTAGLALGWLLSLILIHVINRQSFHWSMDLHTPWEPLLGLAAVLVLASGATAIASGWRATSDDATRAVREDW
jgi:putative ABC transport system permease protein